MRSHPFNTTSIQFLTSPHARQKEGQAVAVIERVPLFDRRLIVV